MTAACGSGDADRRQRRAAYEFWRRLTSGPQTGPLLYFPAVQVIRSHPPGVIAGP